MLDRPSRFTPLAGDVSRHGVERPRCLVCNRSLPVPWPDADVHCCKSVYRLKQKGSLGLTLVRRFESAEATKNALMEDLMTRALSEALEARIRVEDPFGLEISRFIQGSLDALLPRVLGPSSDLPERISAFEKREQLQRLLGQARITGFFSFSAPYVHFRARLFEAVTGPDAAGTVQRTLAVRDLEFARLGFDGALPLPRGVARLDATGKALPLEFAEFEPLHPAPLIDVENRDQALFARITTIRMARHLDVIGRVASLVLRRRAVTYHPFSVLTLSMAEGERHFLADSFSGAYVWEITSDEQETLLRALAMAPELPPKQPLSFLKLDCPGCRVPFEKNHSGDVCFCRACARAFFWNEGRLEEVPYLVPGPPNSRQEERVPYWQLGEDVLAPAWLEEPVCAQQELTARLRPVAPFFRAHAGPCKWAVPHLTKRVLLGPAEIAGLLPLLVFASDRKLETAQPEEILSAARKAQEKLDGTLPQEPVDLRLLLCPAVFAWKALPGFPGGV